MVVNKKYLIIQIVDRKEYDVYAESFSSEEAYQMEQHTITSKSNIFKPISLNFKTIEDALKHIDKMEYPEDYIVQEYYKQKWV